jgi:isoleucyl-tRNA synthetase
VVREPEIQKFWEDNKIYENQRSSSLDKVRDKKSIYYLLKVEVYLHNMIAL